MTAELLRLVDDDPLIITDELIKAWESMTQKKLYPAQIERLFIDLVAYRETLIRGLINDVARQNLVAFARAPLLDFLGELVGVGRLPAQPARTQVRFSRKDASGIATLIPAGTLIQAVPGVEFATDADVLIGPGPGGDSVVVPATCTLLGSLGNGYLPGQISVPVSLLPASVSAVNLAVSSAGSEVEDDEHLRERIRLAPEAFSVAGPRLAYRFAAMSASSLIVDVAVTSPLPGLVRLHPLTMNGLPSEEIKTLVQVAASAEDVRPLCDSVEVADPLPMPFAVSALLTLYRDAPAQATMERATRALSDFCAQVAGRLGRDLVRSQLVDALHVPGVYRVDIVSPNADMVVPEQGWAFASDISVTMAGVADG